MWHFDKRGFVSVVAYDPKKDRNKSSKFPQIAKKAGTHLLVRARIKEDLDMLKSVVPNLHIETDAAADYAYRCVIPRSKFKKFLANSVDEIDYDSHFKEVARDNSKGSSGRYGAMMSVWNAMANLQPISPWSGGYGGGYWSSGKSSSKGKSSSSTMATPKAISTTAQPVGRKAPKTVEDWVAEYDDGVATPEDFRKGLGPETGYKEGDAVEGYFGLGTVTKVQPRAEGKPDMVTINYEKKPGTTVTSVFLSTYLIPAWDLDGPVKAVLEDTEPTIDVDGAYEDLLKDGDLSKIPVEVLTREYDDDAFELVTRLQERYGQDAVVNKQQVDEVYDEISWENSSESEKRLLAESDVVPAKYEQEAMSLLAKSS